MQWHEIEDIGFFEKQDRKIVKLENYCILVIKCDDKFYAVENRCPHADLPLDDGDIENGEIICKYHGASFKLENGEVVNPPAFEDLIVFPVQIKNNKLFLGL